MPIPTTPGVLLPLVMNSIFRWTHTDTAQLVEQGCPGETPLQVRPSYRNLFFIVLFVESALKEKLRVRLESRHLDKFHFRSSINLLAYVNTQAMAIHYKKEQPWLIYYCK